MQTIPDDLLAQVESLLSPEERDEKAIPSYRHANPLLRWMAWSRIGVLGGWMDRWGNGSDRPVESRKVMDYGCGCGVLLQTAARNAGEVYGVDIVLGAARFLVGKLGLGNVDLMEPEQACERIEQDSLDAIVCGEVLEHLTELDETLTFFRTRLRSDGRLMVSLPSENMLYRMGRRLAGFEGHYHHFNAHVIHRRILDAGFRAVRFRKLPFVGVFAVYWCVEYVPA